MQRFKKCTFSILFLFLIFSQNFCRATEWQQVYLASYPRSGSHWVRFLIEEATGIATSSDYPDIGGIDHNDPTAFHLPTLFPWGAYCTDHGFSGNCRYPNNTDFIVIKTHYPYSTPLNNELHNLQYVKSICLIRNPLDTFYSLYLYENYIRHFDPNISIPRDQLEHYIACWKQFYKFWEEQENVLVIRYEDLYLNPHENLTKILNSIGNSFSYDDLQRAINKFPPRGGINKYVHCFSEKSKEYIQNELQNFLFKYGYEISSVFE